MPWSIVVSPHAAALRANRRRACHHRTEGICVIPWVKSYPRGVGPRTPLDEGVDIVLQRTGRGGPRHALVYQDDAGPTPTSKPLLLT